MLIRPAIGDTDPIRYRRPTPDGQFSGNILDEAMRPNRLLISFTLAINSGAIWGPNVLRRQRDRFSTSSGRLCGSHSKRRQTEQSASPAADQVRARGQPENSNSPGCYYRAV